MAKEPTVSTKTPEQIAAMEEEVRLYRQQEAQARADDDREAAKPLGDLVTSQAFADMQAALPALDALASGRFPALRVHVDAVRNGLSGLAMLAGSYIPPAPEDQQAAPSA